MNVRRSLLLLLGISTVVAPRRMLAIQARINTIGYDGSDALTPQDWLVTLTRIAGVAAITIAVLGPDSTTEREPADDGDTPQTFV